MAPDRKAAESVLAQRRAAALEAWGIAPDVECKTPPVGDDTTSGTSRAEPARWSSWPRDTSWTEDGKEDRVDVGWNASAAPVGDDSTSGTSRAEPARWSSWPRDTSWTEDGKEDRVDIGWNASAAWSDALSQSWESAPDGDSTSTSAGTWWASWSSWSQEASWSAADWEHRVDSNWNASAGSGADWRQIRSEEKSRDTQIFVLPNVDKKAHLMKLVGTWIDGRKSEYDVAIHPTSDRLSVRTRRPDGDVRVTPGLIRVEPCGAQGFRIVWGRLPSFVLETPADGVSETCVWLPLGNTKKSFYWERVSEVLGAATESGDFHTATGAEAPPEPWPSWAEVAASESFDAGYAK